MKDYFRSNKYSIRKFTIGTGSVLIASFFFLSHNEVLASETISKVESPVEGNKVENSVEGNKVESPVEGNKVESPVEGNKVENSVEGNKVESPVEGNKVENSVEGNKVVNVPSPSNSKDNEALLNNKVLATNTRGNDLQTSFRSTFMNRAVAASNSGKLVNDSVHFENLNFRDDRFDANQGEGTRLRGDFKVTDNSIRKGDYFNIKLPDYLNLYGNTSPETVEVPQLNFNNSTIATGIYNKDTNEITYTFTENIEGINNVKGSIDLAMFADRKNAPNSDYYNMHVDAAGETLDKQIKIDYFSVRNLETPLANIESFIVNTTDSKYEQYVYVNPKGSYIGGSYVQISDMIPASNGEHGRDSSSARLDNIDNISIYKVNSNQPMNESFYVDEKIYEDVTENIKRNNDIKLMKNEDGSNTIGIDFRGLLSDGSRYIIKVNGKNISGNFPETRVLMETYDRLRITSGYSWDNQVFKDGSSSDISGEHNNYEIGDYVWEDTNKDGVQNREEKGLTGVTVILKDKEGNEVNRTQTNEEGKYLFTNVKNGDYVVEFETPEGYEATKENAGSKELDSDGQVVNVKVEGSNNYTIDSGFVKTGVPNTPPTTPEEPGVPNTPPTTPEE
ncbi:SdrD B-like domain-containing protein, partial [Staphylococcus chromogenes]|uniref:SdrD B-like domain-containing protein n=2 Tax=Staphylococcus chromogenes TaxID=46126 RepID=UPI001C58BDCC